MFPRFVVALPLLFVLGPAAAQRCEPHITPWPCTCIGGDVDHWWWWHNLGLDLSITGCDVQRAAGAASVGTSASVVGHLTLIYCDGEVCNDSDFGVTVASDSRTSQDLFRDPIRIGIGASRAAEVTRVCSAANAEANVWPAGLSLKVCYGPCTPVPPRDGPWPMYRREHTYWCWDGCMEKIIFGFAGPRARSQGTLYAKVDPDCVPGVKFVISLARGFHRFAGECDEGDFGDSPFGSPSADFAPPPSVDRIPLASVKFFSLDVTDHCADGTCETLTTQGVIAEVWDRWPHVTIRLGAFDAPEFGVELPPGGGPVEGARTIEIKPLCDKVVEVTTDLFTDSFSRFDGDVNDDGVLCQDDRELLVKLVNEGVRINNPRYTPRADFDLNGCIDEKDLKLFDAYFPLVTPCT